MFRSPIDVKSFLIGLLLGLCVMFAVGAAAGGAGGGKLEPLGVVHDTTNGIPHTPVVYMIDRETNVVYSQRPGVGMQQVMQFAAKQ